jgi:hypothetical protein
MDVIENSETIYYILLQLITTTTTIYIKMTTNTMEVVFIVWHQNFGRPIEHV